MPRSSRAAEAPRVACLRAVTRAGLQPTLTPGPGPKRETKARVTALSKAFAFAVRASADIPLAA